MVRQFLPTGPYPIRGITLEFVTVCIYTYIFFFSLSGAANQVGDVQKHPSACQARSGNIAPGSQPSRACSDCCIWCNLAAANPAPQPHVNRRSLMLSRDVGHVNVGVCKQIR